MDTKDLQELLDTIDLDFDNIDINDKEYRKNLLDVLEVIRGNTLYKALFDLFAGDDTFDIFEQILNSAENDDKETDGEDKTIEKAKTDKKLPVKTENKPEFIRPSASLSVDTGLQIHRLVQEYVDTMIKPYSKGVISQDTINDAYAGLYEFAAWIYNK